MYHIPILKKSYDRGSAWKEWTQTGYSTTMGICRVELNGDWWKSRPRPTSTNQKRWLQKKKKDKKESVEEWYRDNETRMLYKERYGAEWEEN